MDITDKKVKELYRSITNPIMSLRTEIYDQGLPPPDVMYRKLYDLETKIWRDVQKALNLNQQHKRGVE